MDTENDVIVIGDASALTEQPNDVVTIDGQLEDQLPKTAKLNDDGTVTLKLLVPVRQILRKQGAADEVTLFDTLTMRRLKGHDILKIGEAPKGQGSVYAIALSAGLQPFLFKDIFAKMDGVDVQAAGAVVSYFLGNGPTTGR